MDKKTHPCPHCRRKARADHNGIYCCSNDDCGAEFLICPVCRTVLASVNCRLHGSDEICGESCKHVPVFEVYGYDEPQWTRSADEGRFIRWVIKQRRQDPDWRDADREELRADIGTEELAAYAAAQGWVTISLSDAGSHGTAGSEYYVDVSGKTYRAD